MKWICLVFLALPGLALADECSTLLLREEILSANLRDQGAIREGARVSNFIEGRARDIEADLADGHVISLGSGADIYLPLYLFPRARHIHLIDLLTGWMNGPQSVIREVRHRLQSLHRDVELIETADGNNRVWQVSWSASNGARIEKTVSLHEMNFNDEVAMAELNRSIDKLSGVVATGVNLPLNVRQSMLRRMSAHGSMFTEMVYKSDDGRINTPQDVEDLRILREEFEVIDLGEDRTTYRFNPTKFVIRRRK